MDRALAVTSLCVFEQAKSDFLLRLAYSEVPDDVVAWISDESNYVQLYKPHSIGARTKRSSGGVMWQSCVYHKALAPVLVGGLSRFLCDTSRNHLIASACESNEKVLSRFAWKLKDTPFINSFVQW